MRECISVIKYCSKIAFFFLFLTYAVTVNFEGHFISVDSVWISNNFLLTLFGGIFASMLVVVLCEIQKYLSIRNNTERYLFYQSIYLYWALVQMEINIKSYLENREFQISENLFDESIRMIRSEINALQMTDYATFTHDDDSLMVVHGMFQIESIPKIQLVLQSGMLLQIAVNKTKIDNLQVQLETHTYFGPNKRITSESPRVNRMLNDILQIVSSSIVLVEQYIVALDNCCSKRFRWDEVKEKLKLVHVENKNIYS